jgi:hypothetical protein
MCIFRLVDTGDVARALSMMWLWSNETHRAEYLANLWHPTVLQLRTGEERS